MEHQQQQQPEQTPTVQGSTPGPTILALVPTSGPTCSNVANATGSSALVPVAMNANSLAPGRTVASVSGNNVVLVHILLRKVSGQQQQQQEKQVTKKQKSIDKTTTNPSADDVSKKSDNSEVTPSSATTQEVEQTNESTSLDKDNPKLPRRRPIYETDDLIRELSPPIEGTEDPSTIIGADGTINGRKPVQCNICKRYMPESRLANHIRHLHDNRPSVNPKKNFKCDHCGKQFTIRYTYQQHVKTHTQGRPKCPECGTTFASAFSLFRHRAKNHGIQHNYKTHNCDQCNKTFFSLSELKLHQQRHSTDKEFKCQECNKAFSVKGNLRIHMRTHAKEKLFKCDICGNSFSHPYSLVSHRRIHTNDCPHKCPHCDKAYRAKHQLTSHMIVHTDLRPFKCEQCPKTFRSRTAFKMHQDEHKGIKRFTCKFCERQFQCYGNKLKHERRHIGEKKHKCSYCEKAFIEKQELKNHLKIHERNQNSANNSSNAQGQQPSSSGGTNSIVQAPKATRASKRAVGQVSRLVGSGTSQQATRGNGQEIINDALDIIGDNRQANSSSFFADIPPGQQFNPDQHNQNNPTTTAPSSDPMHGVIIMSTSDASQMPQQQEAQGRINSSVHLSTNTSNSSNVLMQAYQSAIGVQTPTTSGIVTIPQQQMQQTHNQQIHQGGDQYHPNSYGASQDQNQQQWQQSDNSQHANMHCHPAIVASQMNIRFALAANNQQHSGHIHQDPYGQQPQHRTSSAPQQQHFSNRQQIHTQQQQQQQQIATSRPNQQPTNSLSIQQQQNIQQHQSVNNSPNNLTDGVQGGTSSNVINTGQQQSQQVIQTTSANGGRQFHRNQHVACKLCKQLVPDIRHHLIIFHRVELGDGEDISSWYTPANR